MEKQLPLFEPAKPEPPAVPEPAPKYTREFCDRCKGEKALFWQGRAYCPMCDDKEVFGEDAR